MACTKGGSGYNVPLHIIPDFGKGAEDSTEGSTAFKSEDGARVFQDREAGS